MNGRKTLKRQLDKKTKLNGFYYNQVKEKHFLKKKKIFYLMKFVLICIQLLCHKSTLTLSCVHGVRPDRRSERLLRSHSCLKMAVRNFLLYVRFINEGLCLSKHLTQLLSLHFLRLQPTEELPFPLLYTI